VYEGEQIWQDVDRYFIDHLVDEDEALTHARLSSSRTVMPEADVAPNQGAFLSVIAQMCGARRVLEFGTLAGYSTIWLARAVGPGGIVTTFEIDAKFVRTEIELDLERPRMSRNRRSCQPSRSNVERHVPPVVDHRRLGQPHLADDLQPHVKRVTGRIPVIDTQCGPDAGLTQLLP
jgi:hypothetical protein